MSTTLEDLYKEKEEAINHPEWPQWIKEMQIDSCNKRIDYFKETDRKIEQIRRQHEHINSYYEEKSKAETILLCIQHRISYDCLSDMPKKTLWQRFVSIF